jgi:hypothetical protein
VYVPKRRAKIDSWKSRESGRGKGKVKGKRTGKGRGKEAESREVERQKKKSQRERGSWGRAGSSGQGGREVGTAEETKKEAGTGPGRSRCKGKCRGREEIAERAESRGADAGTDTCTRRGKRAEGGESERQRRGVTLPVQALQVVVGVVQGYVARCHRGEGGQARWRRTR